jgi:hypothetical protein
MSGAYIPNEDGSRPEPKPARTLPDVAICRARHSGFGGYADCLVDAPSSSLSDLENTTLTNGAGTILIFREGVLMVQNTLFSAKNA